MVDAYVAISRDLEKEFNASGLAREKVHYSPNGVDTSRFVPPSCDEKAIMRSDLGLPPDRPVVLAVGVLDQRKNIGWLMEEWVRSNAFGTGGLLLAVGPQSREDADGSFIGSLRRLADGKPAILRLQGYVDDIERYYRAADLFILPSHSEGMPNVVLEAMASGLPCVATRVSGVQELLYEAKTGYTYEPGDVDGLGQAVLKVIADVEGVMGRNARQLVERYYSLAKVAGNYEGLYRKLVSASAP
jgi:glycosyltransferase involved in cell wall biosynthesis